jgi:hypothetical protein
VDEDADTKVIDLVFNEATMKKTIPPLPFTVAGEEEKKKIKLQYTKNWYKETLTLNLIY